MKNVQNQIISANTLKIVLFYRIFGEWNNNYEMFFGILILIVNFIYYF